MGTLALRDLREIDGEPRVADLVLGERLGLGRPRDIRKIIQPRLPELGRYGEVSRRSGAKPLPGSKGGRPQYGYFLNEAQALLVCMFSETSVAADVREQVVKVFMAWRRGQLVATTQAQEAPWAGLERRMAQLERLLTGQQMIETSDYAVAVTYAPPVFRLRHSDGRLRKQRYPKFWSDLPVREMVIRLHRQVTLTDAVKAIEEAFGPGRAPSRTALGRVWRQLDQTRGGN